jgi:NDP-sugar pyrophosphorylase family protein
MVPVGGRPLLEHHVLRLARARYRGDIFVNLHHLPEVIREHCGDGSRWGIRIEYRLEPEIRGTAAAVKGSSPSWTSPSS